MIIDKIFDKLQERRRDCVWSFIIAAILSYWAISLYNLMDLIPGDIIAGEHIVAVLTIATLITILIMSTFAMFCYGILVLLRIRID